MMFKLLICTDLDRTLLPNGAQPESSKARPCFSKLVSRAEITLVYVSGRDRVLVEEAITRYSLPVPDYVIGDVGTSIYRVDKKKEWVHQPDWEDKIAQDWKGKNNETLKNALSSITELRLQEIEKQNRYKLSYYVKLSENREELSHSINEKLNAIDVYTRLIWSIDESRGIGLLDILPLSASKLHAIEAVMQNNNFDYSNTVFCGDSGNDLEVLASRVNAVLVANSQPDVKQQAKQLSEKNGYLDQLYIAKGGFSEMNGNYSAGMLEGIAFFYPETIKWMEL